MDLAKYQQLYLNTVYDYFQEKADWPTYRQVEINILPAHRDFNVVEIAKSLVDESHKHLFRVRDLNQPTYLSLDEIRRCPGSEKDLENLIKVVRYSADKYFNSKEKQVEIFSEEIVAHLHMENLAVR